jgi:spore maturation protein CgeB
MVLKINRSSMADFGFSPPARVFEVALAGTCPLCDDWPEIDECFTPGEEIIVIGSAEDVVGALDRDHAARRRRIGEAFHRRALRDHAYARCATQPEQPFAECREWRNPAARRQDYLLEESA